MTNDSSGAKVCDRNRSYYAKSRALPLPRLSCGDRDLLIGGQAICNFVNSLFDIDRPITPAMIYFWVERKHLPVRQGVSRSYFTRVVRLSYLAPDITQAILDGRQPRDLG
jgi:hypothetical protein